MVSPKNRIDEMQRISEIIDNFCTDPTREKVDSLLDEDELTQVDPFFFAIVESYRELHTRLKDELAKTTGMESTSTQQNIPFTLLSLLDNDDEADEFHKELSEHISQMGNKNAVIENEEILAKRMLSSRPHITSVAHLAYEGKEDEINVISLKETLKKGRLQMSTKLEFQLIGSVSIKENTPSKIDQSIQVQSKQVSVSTEANLNDYQARSNGGHYESIEIISAAMIKQQKNKQSNLETGSSMSFSTITSSEQSSEMSMGQISERKATWMFATRPEMTLYEVDSNGALMSNSEKGICQSQSKKREPNNDENILLSRSPTTTLTSRSFSSEFRRGNPPTISGSERKESTENRANNSNLVEVAASQSNQIMSLVAREISFQSSFDTTKLFEFTGEEKSGSNCFDLNGIENEKLEEATHFALEEEEQSTLNQVTPIPTTLELSP